MAETYMGEVRGGVVVFDSGTPPPPEGTKVHIEPIKTAADAPEGPSLYDRLKPIIGSVQGLPPDLAAQHDHYIHGTPKR